MTEVYFIRHSKTLKINNNLNSDNLQLQNEKACLSIDGEILAKKTFNKSEFDNIDVLYSSNYVRAIQTAKYLSDKNNIEVNVVSNFGERKHGVNSWNELPDNFEKRQFEDENFKLNNGESQKDVRDRMYKSLMKVLNENKGKKIAIISHSTAMMFLFGIWCNISYDSNSTFNSEVFFDSKWDYCETFKLLFDDNDNLISIENIK